MKNTVLLGCFLAFLWMGNSQAAVTTVEAESMTLSGPYAGAITSPFEGIALYGNGDKGTSAYSLPDGAGIYEINIRGASSNSSTASVAFYINGERIKSFSFTGTAPSIASATVKLPSIGETITAALVLETDNGSNDTYIDRFTLTFQGAIVIKDPPVLPEQGAFYTDIYRNMFLEAGYSQAEIDAKLQAIWQQLFYGNSETQAIYYPVGTDEAYMLDTGNSDVRTEGMSYGMMLCVQMDKQTEFNRLWKWAKTHQQYTSGQYDGYFAWQMNTNGSIKGDGPASDGEEYFVMALLFASNRWGDGDGIYNYKKEANDLLAHCMKRTDSGGGVTNLFNSTQKQVVFVPYGNSASFTDPSYHLPAFYELWGRWASDKSKRQFWKDCAAKSREMFPLFAHAQTGLIPDYAEFNGNARNDGDHKYFCYDAWRCIMNVAVDYAWFKASEEEVTIVNKIHNFFDSKGIDSYGGLYKLDGAVLNNNNDHSPGLVACNASGSLASNQSVAWDFIDDFFRMGIPSGQYRYYDGMLYLMNFLHLSGNFKIYKPENEEETEYPDPEQEPGYFTIENFNQREINSTYAMHKKNGASSGAATVIASPTDETEQSAQILTANWDEFIRFNATLPANRSWSDYQSLCFDVYYNSAASNSDNGYKDFYIYLDNNEIAKEATGDKNGAEHNVWLYKTIALNNTNAGNTFTIDLGIRSNKANYYIDNVRLKERNELTAISMKNQSTYSVIGNRLLISEGQAENIIVYDLNGKIQKNISNISILDFSSLVSGMYIVKIRQNGQTSLTKIVKY